MSNYDSYGTPKKPDSNCRTCTDFQYWSKQQRQIFNKADGSGDHILSQQRLNSSVRGDNSINSGPSRPDCPLDKSLLGKATWGLLHTMAAFYDEKPTESRKKDMRTFFDVLTRVYPCEYCASDFKKDFAANPINVDSQREFSQWLCNFHNRVNTKLGKPLFDCTKVNERWRDGWLDGSCD